MRLVFSQPNTDAQFRELATVNELTVRAMCSPFPGTTSGLDVAVQSSVGGAIIHGTNLVSDNDAAPVPFPPIGDAVSTASPGTTVMSIISDVGQHKYSFVQATYVNSNRVISLQLYGFADDVTDGCEVYGTAVPAS